jgi:hypothetical protein
MEPLSHGLQQARLTVNAKQPYNNQKNSKQRDIENYERQPPYPMSMSMEKLYCGIW